MRQAGNIVSENAHRGIAEDEHGGEMLLFRLFCSF